MIERIDSPDERHYRTPDGVFPSVTTILKATATAETRAVLDAWRVRVGEKEAERVRVAAADRGTSLHAKIEAWLAEDPLPDPDDLHPDCPWWRSVLPFLQSVTRALLIEEYVWNAEVGYAGALDALVEVRSGLIILADWKTSDRQKRKEWITDYFLQGAAYAHALPADYHVDRVAVVIAYPDRRADVHIMSPQELAAAWTAFQVRAAAYHAGARP